MNAYPITQLEPTADTIAQLCDTLIETVASGGSVGFMDPLPRADAQAFWHGSLTAAQSGKRVVFGAWDRAVLAGTVTLLLDLPPNQPHRAEIAKLMVRAAYRGRGIARAMMHAAHASAAAHGRSLVVLDTAAQGGAPGLYETLGYTLAGEIPFYALKPQGGLTATLLYWKVLIP
jgi:ribosomal protein S18 acetylase RimI-like enzyme